MIISRQGKLSNERLRFSGECKACGCVFHIDVKRSHDPNRSVLYEVEDVLSNMKLMTQDGPDYFLCDCPECHAPHVKITQEK